MSPRDLKTNIVNIEHILQSFHFLANHQKTLWLPLVNHPDTYEMSQSTTTSNHEQSSHDKTRSPTQQMEKAKKQQLRTLNEAQNVQKKKKKKRTTRSTTSRRQLHIDAYLQIHLQSTPQRATLRKLLIYCHFMLFIVISLN